MDSKEVVALPTKTTDSEIHLNCPVHEVPMMTVYAVRGKDPSDKTYAAFKLRCPEGCFLTFGTPRPTDPASDTAIRLMANNLGVKGEDIETIE